MNACRACEAIRMADWYRRNSEKQRAAASARYAKNRPLAIAAMAKYRERNRESINEKISAYRRTPDGRRKKADYDKDYAAQRPGVVSSHSRRYREKNPEKVLALTQARRADRLRAINLQDMEFLRFVMQEANRLAKARSALTGNPWEVDHIFPLRGRSVSGLHNPFNLQVIPRSINRRKSNRVPLSGI
jgi:hypothetical protein